MGSATLFQLASRGADVLGILISSDPPHEARLEPRRDARHATCCGRRNGAGAAGGGARTEIWKELEGRTDESLFGQVGFLAISSEPSQPGAADYVTRTRAVAQRSGVLSRAERPAGSAPPLSLAECCGGRPRLFRAGGRLSASSSAAWERSFASPSTPARDLRSAAGRSDRFAMAIARRIRSDRGRSRRGVSLSAGAWAGRLLGRMSPRCCADARDPALVQSWSLSRRPNGRGTRSISGPMGMVRRRASTASRQGWRGELGHGGEDARRRSRMISTGRARRASSRRLLCALDRWAAEGAARRCLAPQRPASTPSR